MPSLKSFALATVTSTALHSIAVQALSGSGTGTTTRYWDCCKPSCAWSGKGVDNPVKTCDVHDNPITDVDAKSGCEGGPAYMCSSQAPWAVSDDLAYGFTAVSGADPACCACYKLTFTSGPASGKKMIVQATNTGGDVGATQFDLAMPGGGFGIYDGCSTEWGATSSVWGQQYGGSKTNTCSKFPSKLQSGCNFRWGWMKGADNPNVNWESVACPAELVAKSGCGTAGGSSSASASSSSSSSSSSAATSSSSTSSSTSNIAAAATSSTSPSTTKAASSNTSSASPAESSTSSENTKSPDVKQNYAVQQDNASDEDECEAEEL